MVPAPAAAPVAAVATAIATMPPCECPTITTSSPAGISACRMASRTNAVLSASAPCTRSKFEVMLNGVVELPSCVPGTVTTQVARSSAPTYFSTDTTESGRSLPLP
ncbi:hypothetical protein D3C74_348840 [compost metagenome]